MKRDGCSGGRVARIFMKLQPTLLPLHLFFRGQRPRQRYDYGAAVCGAGAADNPPRRVTLLERDASRWGGWL